jgi:hypothetical protein
MDDPMCLFDAVVVLGTPKWIQGVVIKICPRAPEAPLGLPRVQRTFFWNEMNFNEGQQKVFQFFEG